MEQTLSLKCVYCGGGGPFDEEHVFSAGMGGDDKSFVLVDLVCCKCNNKIFSKLELSVMRRSPTGLRRKFSQSKSRDRGSKTRAPSIVTSSHFIIDNHGRCLEAEYAIDGTNTMLAQILIEDNKVYFTASDDTHLRKLYSSLARVLEVPVIHLIDKVEGSNSIFDVTTYEWFEDEYRQLASEVLSEPPATGIWLQTFADKHPNASPRVYQRLAGQLNLRIPSKGDPAQFLRSMRRTLPSMSIKKESTTENLIEQPIIHIEMNADLESTTRVLAKTGVNLLIHTFGKEFVTRPEFDEVKKFVLTGIPARPLSLLGDKAKYFADILFGSIPKQSHCAMLVGVPAQNNTYDIYFNVCLYGSDYHSVLIAKELPSDTFFEPIYLLVNYEENIIKKLSRLEYQVEILELPNNSFKQ